MLASAAGPKVIHIRVGNLIMADLHHYLSRIWGNEKLSAREIAELRDWLEELDARLFDEKIERDAKAGKLDKLADEARANLKAGRGEEF